jgi:teichoic acid transport system permease protein
MSTTQAPIDWDADLRVYEPHKAGLPKLKPYFRDLFARLPFASEFSKATIRAAHSQTTFGTLWLVLNPLLLASVYYVLVSILSHRGGIGYLTHIVAGLFVFNLISGSISTGASSVTTAGKLILNMPFPRLLMPMAAVRTAFFRFLPTLPVYLIIKAFSDTPWRPSMILGVYFLAMMGLFSIGAAAVMATLTVYFRDTSSFLPFFLRIWLYLSPVLWTLDDAPQRFEKLMMFGNPLYSLIGGWTELTLQGEIPSATVWLTATGWALVALLFGAFFFMSRERDFAVRI